MRAVQASRSRQGKMEKSLLSFAATYPTWEPDAAAKQMLMALGQAPPLRGAPANSADMASMQSAVAASLFPGAPRLVALCHCSPESACGLVLTRDCKFSQENRMEHVPQSINAHCHSRSFRSCVLCILLL